MVGALQEAMNKLTRLPIQDRFMGRAHRQCAADIAYMRNLVDDVIRQRRAAPTAGMDLLNLMLEARDPETDRRLDDANIRNQVITFLIAGHETTSGLLTFALYELLRNPGVLAQAYAEVDAVLPGDAAPVYADLARMPVLDRVLKETLRLWPTAPAFAVAPFDDVVIGGRYHLRKDRRISVVLTALHRDPQVWAHPERFDIDRFLPEHEARLPAHAYMPFGQGERACIGRQFALTEAKLALALMLRHFAFHDPYDYQFKLKETLTIKPDNLVLRARRRRLHERIAAQPVAAEATPAAQAEVRGHGQALTVLCASSLGTARAGRADPRRGGRRRFRGEAAGSGRHRRRAAGVGRGGDRRRYRNWPRAGLGPPGYAGGCWTPHAAAGYRADGLRLALLGRGNSQWATVSGVPAPRVRLLHGGRRRAAAGARRSRWQRRLRPVRRTLAGPALAGPAGRWRGPGRGGHGGIVAEVRSSAAIRAETLPRRDAGLHGLVEYRTCERSRAACGLLS